MVEGRSELKQREPLECKPVFIIRTDYDRIWNRSQSEVDTTEEGDRLSATLIRSKTFQSVKAGYLGCSNHFLKE